MSAGCTDLVETAEKAGAISSGGVTAQGATIFVDNGWARMGFEAQKTMAECVSHYMAGSQDKWVSRTRFLNQRTGVVLGTMEGIRYRAGQ